MTTATETTQKSAADYLDEHWFSLASGGEGESSFAEILNALNFDPKPEINRAKTVLSLMNASKDRHALAVTLEQLQAGSSGATLKASKAAIQAAREEAQAAEAELDAAFDALGQAEDDDADDKVVESLRVTAESLKASYPERLKAIRHKEFAAHQTRVEIEQQIDEVSRALQTANEAWGRLADQDLLPLHVRRKARPQQNGKLNAKRIELDALITKGQVVLRFCDPALKYTNDNAPPVFSIEEFLRKTGSPITSAQLWKQPEQHQDPDWQVISPETFATVRAHATAALAKLRSELRSVNRQIEAGNAEYEAGSTYYQDKL